LGFAVERVTGIEPALSAWELACHASLTGASQVSCHLRLSASARRVPVLTALSGTQRARSPARHRQLGRSVMAGLTRRAGMYVQVTDVDCPWLAVSDRWSSWHLAAHGPTLVLITATDWCHINR